MRSLSPAITDESTSPRCSRVRKGEKGGGPPGTSAADRMLSNCKEVVYSGLSQSLKTQLRSLFKMPQKPTHTLIKVGPQPYLLRYINYDVLFLKKILVDSRPLIKAHENDTMSRRLLILLFFFSPGYCLTALVCKQIQAALQLMPVRFLLTTSSLLIFYANNKKGIAMQERPPFIIPA